MLQKQFFHFFWLLMVLFIKSSFAQDLSVDKSKIEQVIGVKGAWFEEEEVFKITFPRTDVKVAVDHWNLPPFMGLSSWISFISIGDSLMTMGDVYPNNLKNRFLPASDSH